MDFHVSIAPSAYTVKYVVIHLAVRTINTNLNAFTGSRATFRIIFCVVAALRITSTRVHSDRRFLKELRCRTHCVTCVALHLFACYSSQAPALFSFPAASASPRLYRIYSRLWETNYRFCVLSSHQPHLPPTTQSPTLSLSLSLARLFSLSPYSLISIARANAFIRHSILFHPSFADLRFQTFAHYPDVNMILALYIGILLFKAVYPTRTILTSRLPCKYSIAFYRLSTFETSFIL
jgi:hypothetical protein